MKREYLEKSVQHLLYQRNAFLAMAVILCLTTFSMSLFLFSKRERFIVAPPVISQEFWVDSKGVSPTYIEQFGCFLGQLLLGKSALSAPSQREVLLRHTTPDYSGILRKRLIEEEEMLAKQSASYAFFPVQVKVNPESLEVTLLGDRVFFVLGDQVSITRESYSLRFTYDGHRMLLKEVTARGEVV